MLDNLSPHLAEFDLHCANEDYDRAAEVLLEFDYRYLYLWGCYGLLVRLHEQLRGKVSNPLFKEQSLGHLGIALAELGDISHAISVTSEALAIAQRIDATTDRVLWLGNLGTMHYDNGETVQAIQYYEKAAEVNVQASNSQYLTAVNLIYQGECYGNLGELEKAIGQLERACKLAENAWEPARPGLAHAHLALVLVDASRWAEAIEHAHRAIDIGRYTNVARVACLGGVALGLAWLGKGNLAEARSAIMAAYQCDQALHNHFCQALLGIVALRQCDHKAALRAFTTAVDKANDVLKYNPRCFRALDSIGLVFAARSVSGEAENMVLAAVDVHRKARQINRDTGTVARLLRLYDVLSPLDPTALLAPARAAVSGD